MQRYFGCFLAFVMVFLAAISLSAQAPELSPLDMEMPLPPSTSGQTSRPEMTIGLSGFTALLYQPCSARRKTPGLSVMMLSAPQPRNCQARSGSLTV